MNKHTIIKLDIDTKDEDKLQANAQQIYWMLHTLNLTTDNVQQYETGKGWHRVIEIKEPLQPLEIVLVQALCGSDLKREAFNMARVLKLSDAPTFWQARWNVLYSEKLLEDKKNDKP